MIPQKSPFAFAESVKTASIITITEKMMKNNADSFIKRIVALALSIISVCCVFAGCNPKKEEKEESGIKWDNLKCVAENGSAYVWGAPDTVNIMRDVAISDQCGYWGDEWLADSDKLECEGIKGDTEAVQVMLTAKKDVSSFNLTAVDLTREGGDEKIDASDVEILAERYIETKKSSARSNTASEFLGWYADALVPMAAYKASRENKIAKGDNQGIWVNIPIPEDAAAGLYKGNFRLEIDGETLALPVSVKVYNVVMPTQIHAQTAFDIWYEEIKNGEEETDDEGNPIEWGEIYYDFVASKRICPQTTEYMRTAMLSQSTYSRFVGEMVKISRNEKLTSFRMPYRSVVDSEYGVVVNYDLLVGILRAMAEKNVELLAGGEDIDLFKKAYFYFNSFIDEPTPDKYEAVRYCDRAVTQAKKTVAPLLDEYPEVQKSLLAIPHMVTGKVDFLDGNEETGGVQCWTAQTQQYTSDVLKNVSARKNSTDKYSCGENFWIYMTMESNNPYPSLQLDDNLLSPRTLFWMNKCYDISSILYWCTCYYSKAEAQGGNNVKKVSRDVWNDPNSYVNVNGDAYLLYPGSKYGLKTPISTLRLESLRQGSEDYEYLWLLENAVAEYNEKHGKDYDVSEITKKFYGGAFLLGSTISNTNVKKFADARSELLTLLDAVMNETSDVETLLSTYQSYAD